MPFQDPRMFALKTEFKVKGMPRLIVFKKDGTCLDDNAVENVIEEGPELIMEWL